MIKYRQWFSGDKLPPPMRKSSETDSKKKASLKQSQNSPKMSPVAEKKRLTAIHGFCPFFFFYICWGINLYAGS